VACVANGRRVRSDRVKAVYAFPPTVWQRKLGILADEITSSEANEEARASTGKGRSTGICVWHKIEVLYCRRVENMEYGRSDKRVF